jgi:hypothetical protein
MDKMESNEEIDYEKMIKSDLFQKDKAQEIFEDPEQVDFQKINYFKRRIKNIEIRYKGRKNVELENILDQVTATILDEDWESQGGTNFNKNTIKRAKDLVVDIMDYFSDQRIEFFPPKILPLLDGSLDIKWENNLFRLIVNIPSEISHLVEIYGDLKHSIPEENNEADCRIPYIIVKVTIIEWLKKILRYGR